MDPDDLIPNESEEAEEELAPEVDDPADDLPTETLGPDAPRVPNPAENDADPELKKQFWSLVLLFNVALFGMSLGLMLAGFRGQLKVGGAVFAVGAFALVRGLRGYRDATANISDED